MSFSLLRRSRPGPRRVPVKDGAMSPSVAAPHIRQFSNLRTHATADFTEGDDDEDDEEEEEEEDVEDEEGPGSFHQGGLGRYGSNGRNEVDEAAIEDDEDDHDDLPRRRSGLPVLPLFSSTHLDTLPVYSMTHAIRILVSTRTETTLTWEQLRSPQVSQFLIKPMQQQIRTQHFSRATLYALMANCLQFTKEAQWYAANAGTSNTRAKVCELLALKILKEYSTRELIDALAYDFYPLQGMPGVRPPATAGSGTSRSANTLLTASRTSTLEVAIRASAKHFLAHPVIVQQLEAIWNGAISFYSSADTLHRELPSSPFEYSNGYPKVDERAPLLGSLPPKPGNFQMPPGRRTVMLYDPRQASMLKLSRLRVPRYRSFLSTVSLAVLIALFLAVLSRRSAQITGLELIFWFWSAGFMLDELVGFNEQGFALYIMSFWNIFDLGILVLLIAYYCMRVYGVFLADPHHWNAMAYDVLAANAILLLPRIFSILDHYQYFSQLLIAFRLMAVDLAAVCVLILIVCSGFFVFFTSSQTSKDGSAVAFQIFQLLMGFTPAAWDVWPSYNWLARLLLCLFLIICHFLVVTILITVLTNSFMAIASNANEEHQFLFAINTISMVKNDALFSYIAPSNIFAWLLMPLRYCMPLKQFVSLNRMIIKVTHFPVLFCIYLYERFWLAPSVYEPTDLIENHGRGRSRTISFDLNNRTALFSPGTRVREESVAGFQKDRALEELFLRLPDAATMRTQRRQDRRKTQTAIRNWMDRHDDDGASAHWGTMDGRAVPDWQRRLSMGWDRGSYSKRSISRHLSDVRSVASDPADFMSNVGASFMSQRASRTRLHDVTADYKDQTDADGDDELVTNDEDEDDAGTNAGRDQQGGNTSEDGEDYFTTPMASRSMKIASSQGSSSKMISPTPAHGAHGRKLHSRTMSTNTILYNPEEDDKAGSSHSGSPPKPPSQGKRISITDETLNAAAAAAPPPITAATAPAAETSAQGARRSPPRRSIYTPATKPRPVPPQPMPGAGGVSRTALMSLEPRARERVARRLSSADLSILSDNNSMPFGVDANSGLAGSFQTQMAMAMMKDNHIRNGGRDGVDRDRMGRLVLARMKTLEESFADIIKEMRDLKNSSTAPTTRRNSSGEELRAGSSLEMAQNDRLKSRKGTATPKKSTGRRPGSRRSMKDAKFGFTMTEDPKGKGKQPMAMDDDEDNAGRGGTADAFIHQGSSL